MTASLLEPTAVHLGLRATDRFDAVTQAGRALLQIGAVDEPYLDAMLERERGLSTYLGEGFALPHGTDASRVHVRRPAIAVLQFPDGVEWDGEQVHVAIAVASASDEHVRVLAALATVITDPDRAEQLRTATDPEVVMELLKPSQEEEVVP
ncbi:MAG TPA: PTS sugar transporter subunit IIA [Solirubrobacteraceae bacterium]|jgi:mannitol/fructose-specific phosphotransferase system IIA component